MINQVAGNTNKSVFAPLQSNSVPYAITKPITPTQKQAEEKEKEKKYNHLGANIFKLALVSGLGILILMKGIPPTVKRKLTNWGSVIEGKTSKYSQNLKNLSWPQKIFYGALKITKPILNNIEAIFTLANLKDILVKKGLELCPPLAKAGDKITEWFEKVSVRMSRRKYISTLSRSEKMFADFADANRLIKDSNVAKNLNQGVENVRTFYTQGFNEAVRNERFERSKKAMDTCQKKGSLAEQFWEETLRHPWKFFTERKNYTKFLAEDLLHTPKNQLHEEVAKLREKFSTSFMDNYRGAYFQLKKFSRKSDPADVIERRTIKHLKELLLECKKAGKFDENSKKNILGQLRILQEKHPDNERIQKIINIITEDKKGELQCIMEKYKRNLSPEEYQKLEKSVNKFLDSLHVAIDNETDKLFDKVRDLKIGSAPKDTLGVLASIGAVGWGLSKADNNDERVSVSLKYGIPAIGGVLTALYCTLGLVAAGPSLLIGLASGIAISKIGTIADNMRKRYKKNQPIIDIDGIKSINLSPIKVIKDIENNTLNKSKAQNSNQAS